MKTELMSKQPRKTRRWILNGVALVALAGIGLAALTLNGGSDAAPNPPIPPGYALASWQDNGANGRYLLEITGGQVPDDGVRTPEVVVSDSNCMPDDAGLSHCVNEIRFADGGALTVIDNHNMSINRCLQPGETVQVSLLSDGWAVALTDDAPAVN